MGTHNVHRAAELLRDAGTAAPITEIFDAAVVDDHALFPSALPVVRERSFNAWVTIQIGCDNHCAFCIVPAVRGVEISRPFDEIVGEVERARRCRGHRDHPARPERQQLRTRPPARRPPRRRHDGTPPAAVRRPAPQGRCRRRHPPDPVHVTASQGHARRDVRGDGRDRRPCARSCTTRCSRARIASWPPCIAATPPSATSHGSPRRGGWCPTSPCRPTSSSASPARPTTTSSARSRSPPRPASTTPSRSSSRRGPAPRRRRWPIASSPPPSPPSASPGCASSSSAARWPATSVASGVVEEVLVEGPSKKDPAVLAARTRQHRLVHFASAEPGARRLVRRRSRSPGPPRTTSPVDSSSVLAEPAHKLAHPRRRAVTRRAGRRARADGVGQVRRRDGRGDRCRRHRDRRRRRHAGLPRDGHRHRQAVGRRPRSGSRTTASTWSSRASRSPSPTTAPPTTGRSPSIAGRPLLVAGTGLYLAAVVDRLDVPGRWPDVRARLARRAAERAVACGSIDLDPTAASRIDPGNRRRVERALEVSVGSGRPFSSYGPGVGAYPPTTHADDRPALAAARCWRRASSGESRR